MLLQRFVGIVLLELYDVNLFSLGIIFHTHDEDDASFVRFREAEDKYFNRLLI